MTVHHRRSHHHPKVKRRRRRHWYARCPDCGYLGTWSEWRPAFIEALRHAEGHPT